MKRAACAEPPSQGVSEGTFDFGGNANLLRLGGRWCQPNTLATALDAGRLVCGLCDAALKTDRLVKIENMWRQIANDRAEGHLSNV